MWLRTLGAAALVACTVPASDASPQSILLAVARSTHEVVALSSDTGAVLARAPTQRGPHEIAVSGPYAFVPNLGSYPTPHAEPREGSPEWIREPTGTVTRIDLRDMSTTTWRLQSCARPHGVEAALESERVWVTCEDASSVQELDAVTGQRQRTFEIGQAGVHEIAALPGRRLATANTSGSVSVIDLQTGEISTVHTGGGATEGMLVSEDGGALYVLSAAQAKLSVVDLATLRVARQVTLDTRFPLTIVAPRGSNEVWIAGNQSNEILILDLNTLQQRARIPLGTQPLGMVASGDGERVYLTLPRRNEVVVLNTRSRSEISRYRDVMEGDGLALVEGPLRP